MCGFVEKCFIAAVKNTQKNLVVCISIYISIYLTMNTETTFQQANTTNPYQK